MIPRLLGKKILQWSQEYPVVTVTGPRQSGKSTLCKYLFPDKPYVNLEDFSLRYFIQEDPKGFLERYPEGAFFDEVQRFPALCSYLQVLVDTLDRPGLFILTASSQFELMETLSQSLAGRTAIGRLLPFSFPELYGSPGATIPPLDDLLYTGFFPRIHDKKLNPTEALSFYVATYLERDIRQILHIKDWTKFDLFLRLLAGRSGQVLNVQSLANETGMSHHTITAWIGVLEQSGLVYRLKPYFSNLGKRLVKNPKLYLLDSGLLCYLLSIYDPKVLSLHPLRGQVFESFVVAELLKERYNQGLPDTLYYYRDQKGLEVDLVVEEGNTLTLGEIKSSATFHPDFVSSLDTVGKALQRPCRKILFLGFRDQPYRFRDCEVRGYTDVSLRATG